MKVNFDGVGSIFHKFHKSHDASIHHSHLCCHDDHQTLWDLEEQLLWKFFAFFLCLLLLSTAKWHANRVTIALRSSGDAVSASQHEVCLSWTSHIHITHFAHHCHLRINCVVSELDLIGSALGYLQANSYSKSLKSYHNSITTCRLKFSVLNRAKFQISIEFLGFFKKNSSLCQRSSSSPWSSSRMRELSERGEKMIIWCDNEKRDDMIMLTLLMNHACMHACFIHQPHSRKIESFWNWNRSSIYMRIFLY
jgi:hypothetical protein